MQHVLYRKRNADELTDRVLRLHGEQETGGETLDLRHARNEGAMLIVQGAVL